VRKNGLDGGSDGWHATSCPPRRSALAEPSVVDGKLRVGDYALSPDDVKLLCPGRAVPSYMNVIGFGPPM